MDFSIHHFVDFHECDRVEETELFGGTSIIENERLTVNAHETCNAEVDVE